MKKSTIVKLILTLSIIVGLILLISLDHTITDFTVKLDGKEDSLLLHIQRDPLVGASLDTKRIRDVGSLVNLLRCGKRTRRIYSSSNYIIDPNRHISYNDLKLLAQNLIF